MTRKTPWHSIWQQVHHVCTSCNAAKEIEPDDLREGTGGKPLCRECEAWINKRSC